MKRNKYATQGACLAHALMKRPMTYLEMQMIGVSTSPQKRVAEWLRLNPDWDLVKGERRGLVTWSVVRGQRKT